MNSNIIKKQIQLNSGAAASLFKKYEAINELGTGILSSIQNIKNQQSIPSSQQVKKLQFGGYQNLKGLRAVYVKIQSPHIATIGTIKKLLQQIYSLKYYSQMSDLFSGFFLEWKQQFDQIIFIQVIRYLQYQKFVVLIEPQVSFNNWKDYQLSLSIFSHFVLQNQNIFLASISLILTFPPFESPYYSKILLSVWKRVIPCGIGRLALKDNNLEDYLLRIHDLFHVKSLQLNWKIQFLTSKTNNWQQLQQRVVGII